ncbi:TetR family transcriptional regulator [Microlunatus panaciterrae]|uniref:AcrR family transcriptional regulator n=1 Tax=Microlunatus panaciterrae TaxID=400768 RepID=A0ABS2RP31_9ACTN|nr:TetR family transcriptional regulator [Microlunatus panaciterrae]MBM7799936.1 AcrR family transcriptional regulator [Microlunatus panaciterrae]
MVRDAGRTKQRLLEAAVSEFATYGIAGARVDRIADSAECNKSLIYTYFGSKDALFEAVATALVADTVEEVPIDAEHLDHYAAALFDHYGSRPELLRLATWYQLERSHLESQSDLIRSANATKVAAVARAQQAGAITTEIEAAELLSLIVGLSTTAALHSPGLDLGSLSATARSRARAALITAVRRLVAVPST